MTQGRLFRFVRAIVRPFYPIDRAPERGSTPEPAVFVCRHKNMRGPIVTMLRMRIAVRPWVYYVFCERDSCYEHFMNYTLTVRMHWPRWYARTVSWILSRVLPSLMRSMGGIPVYRDSVQTVRTFRRSLEALRAGDNLIIYPDVNYTDMSEDVGMLYDGYLLLSRMYEKATGGRLAFVPLYVDEAGREIHCGVPVYFDNAKDFQQEKERVCEQIGEELRRLSIKKI